MEDNHAKFSHRRDGGVSLLIKVGGWFYAIHPAGNVGILNDSTTEIVELEGTVKL